MGREHSLRLLRHLANPARWCSHVVRTVTERAPGPYPVGRRCTNSRRGEALRGSGRLELHEAREDAIRASDALVGAAGVALAA